MTDHDDSLARALHDLPTGAQRTLESIEQRARSIRNRRHTAIAGTALVTAGLIALPAVAQFDDPRTSDSPPATTVTAGEPEPQDCESDDSARGEALALDQVPDRLRLLWDDQAAPPPEEASSVVISDPEVIERMRYDHCQAAGTYESPFATTGVFTFDGGLITRVVTISGPFDEPYVDSGDTRTLDSAAGTIIIVEPGTNDTRLFQAHWPAAGGGYWSAWVQGAMPLDAELVELAESVRLSDGSIDLGSWSGAEGARVWDYDSEPFGVPDPTLMRYEIHGSVSLIATHEGSANMTWSLKGGVEPGEVVDVNGNPGVLSGTKLRWSTADGVLVELSGADGDELLDIARTVGPVQPDDERLVEAWRMPDS